MAPAVMAGMAAMNYVEKQKAADEQRRQQQASILQQSASALGAPTYNVQAARANRAHGMAKSKAMGDMASGALASYLAKTSEQTPAAAVAPAPAMQTRTAPPVVGQVSNEGGGPSAYGELYDPADPEFDAMMADGNALTGFDDEEDPLASIGIY